MSRLDKWTYLSNVDNCISFNAFLQSHYDHINIELSLTYRLRSIQFLYRREDVSSSLKILKSIHRDLENNMADIPNHDFLFLAVAELFSRFHLLKGKLEKSNEWSLKGIIKCFQLEECERTGLMFRARGKLLLKCCAKATEQTDTNLTEALNCFSKMTCHFQKEVDRGGEFEFYVLEGLLLQLYTLLYGIVKRLETVSLKELSEFCHYVPLDSNRICSIFTKIDDILEEENISYLDIVALIAGFKCAFYCAEFQYDQCTNKNLDINRKDCLHDLECGNNFEISFDEMINAFDHLKHSEHFKSNAYTNPSFNFLLEFSAVLKESFTASIRSIFHKHFRNSLKEMGNFEETDIF